MDPSPPIAAPKRRNLVLGLGNPIVSDDAVGILVAREVGRLLDGHPGIEVVEASVAGFDLLELLSGHERAILVDAIKTPGGRPGTIYRLLPDDLPTTERTAAFHEINLPAALALGRMLGTKMPDEVLIYAVEVLDDRTFGENLSPAVSAAVAKLAIRIVHEITAVERTGIAGETWRW